MAQGHGHDLEFYGSDFGQVARPPTPFQLRLLAELGSGETLRSALRKNGLTGPYSSYSWQVDRAKRLLNSRTITQAVLVAIQRGYLSEPTGADMRVIPMLDSVRVVERIEIEISFDTERRITQFEVDGKPMVGRWGITPEGWSWPAKYFNVLSDGSLETPLTVAPGKYTISRA